MLQPADVSWFKSIKNSYSQKWSDWFRDEEKIETVQGNLRGPGYVLISKWICEIWQTLDQQLLIDSFRYCGISGNSNEYHSELQKIIIEGQIPNNSTVIQVTEMGLDFFYNYDPMYDENSNNSDIPDSDHSFVSLGQITDTKNCTHCEKKIPPECDESVACEVLNCNVLLCYSCQPISYRTCDRFYCKNHLENENVLEQKLSQSFSSMNFNFNNKCSSCNNIIDGENLSTECEDNGCGTNICLSCLPITHREGDPYLCKKLAS